MKKFFTIALIGLLCGLCASAQTTSPRFGIPPSGDNTGRALTYNIVMPTDATGTDTLNLNLNAWQTLVRPAAALTDSLRIQFTSVSRCRVGDQVTFMIAAPAGGSRLLRFIGSNYVVGSDGTALTAAASKVATITFLFNGTAWLEQSRFVQP